MKPLLNKFSSFFLEGGLKETVYRFALSSLCALAACAVIILHNHGLLPDSDGRILAVFAFGFFWFGAVRLIAENKIWIKAKEFIFGLIGFIPVVLLMLFAEQFAQYLIFLIPAVLLFIMIAPFTDTITRHENDFSFWQFNQTLWTGVIVSFVVIGIVMAGLHGAVASIEALFDVDFPHNVMEDIWAVSALLIAPIYALSWVPKKFDYLESRYKEPKGLAFMLNWILAPLLLIYFLIFYAYLLKIIAVQELPRGVLSYMVAGFAGVGIVSYLAGWPLRAKSGALLHKIYKYLFPALAVPVILQFIAIGLRVHEYGITEQRYMVVLSALWVGALVVLFTAKRGQASIKIIPTLLAVLFLVAAFGPWGAVGLSGHSQFNRLESLLVKNNILQEGQVIKTDAEISFDDRKNISSKLQYLDNTNRFEDVLAWLLEDKRKREVDENHEGEAKNISYYDITKLMGFDYVGAYQRSPRDDHFNFNSYGKKSPYTDVRRVDFISRNLSTAYNASESAKKRHTLEADKALNIPEISWELRDKSVLVLSVQGRGDVVFDLKPMIEKERKAGHDSKARDLTLTKTRGNMKIRLVFTSISGKIIEDNARTLHASFVLHLDL